MGQSSSTLEKTRATNENDQSPTTKNSFSKRMKLFKQVLRPKTECAASPSGTIENADSSLRETFSKVLHINRRGAVYAPNALLNLPTELILGIAKDLSPSNYMSLSYSCRTIRNKMGASRAHVLGNEVPKGYPGSMLSVELRNIRYLERWELRCMLDRDAEILSSKASRGGRKKTDDCSTLSVRRLPRLTTKHRSSGSAGLVWICPHRILSFGKARSPLGDRDLIQCGYVRGRARFLGLGLEYQWPYVKHRPIMRVPRNRAPSTEEVKEALSSLNAPVCPHLHLNDACVASAYAQDCLSLRCWWRDHGRARWDPVFLRTTWYSESPPTIAICNFCDVTIHFSKYENFRGLGETLDLAVVRHLERIWNRTDRAWICHVADPADFKEYEEAWQATDAECWRRISQH